MLQQCHSSAGTGKRRRGGSGQAQLAEASVTHSEQQGVWVTLPLHLAGIHGLRFGQACRSAIMFGDKLTHEQCVDVVQSLARCKYPFQCAHGRPSAIPLTAVAATINHSVNSVSRARSVPSRAHLKNISLM